MTSWFTRRLESQPVVLPSVRISRKEAFSFGLARKLLAHYEGTPLHLDMRSVLDKIAESLAGDITVDYTYTVDNSFDAIGISQVASAGNVSGLKLEQPSAPAKGTVIFIR